MELTQSLEHGDVQKEMDIGFNQKENMVISNIISIKWAT